MELSPYFQRLSTSLHQTPPEHSNYKPKQIDKMYVAEVQMNWKLEPSQSKHIVGIGFKIVLYVFIMEILTILWTAITSSYDEKTTFEINYWTDNQTKLPGQIMVGIGIKVIFVVGVDTLNNLN